MSGVFSVAGGIVTALIIGIAVSHTQTAAIISSIGDSFAKALSAAKP
jgi:hypothetical protein